MDPATLSIIGTVVSAGVGFMGQMQQASAQRQQAEYQAAVARNNQIIAEQNARYAVAAGEAKAQVQSFKNKTALGAIGAAQSASGLAFDSPTLMDVREGAEQIGRLDSATIAHEAQLAARAQNIQGQNYVAESQLEQMRARNARTAGLFSGGGSLLGGATSFADKWMRFQQQGVSGFGSL